MNVPIKIPSGIKVAVIGDIHEHREQLDKLLQIIKPSPNIILVSVGDIYDKGFGRQIADGIVDLFQPMVASSNAYVLRGNHELKLISKSRKNNSMTPHLEWMDKQPLAVSFEFVNGMKLSVLHGGVLPRHTWHDIYTDIEVCYIRDIDENGEMIKKVWKKDVLVPEKPGGTTWHKSYDGRFGYIASGHDAQRDAVPKFYNYSCNLDTAVYHTGVLTAQIFDENGRGDLIMVSGTAAKPAYLKHTDQ